jgi:hypothetical protein
MQAPGASLDEIDKGQSGCAACAQFRKTDSLGPEARNPGQRDRAPHTDDLSGMHAACVKHPVSGRKNLRLNLRRCKMNYGTSNHAVSLTSDQGLNVPGQAKRRESSQIVSKITT